MASLSVWPAVLHALVEGEQIALVVDEEPVIGAEVELTPDGRTERAELLKPAYRRWAGEVSGLGSPTATVVGAAAVDAETAAKLAGRCIWTEDYDRTLPGAGRWVSALRVRGAQGDPVLSDGAFAGRLRGVVGDLPKGSWRGHDPG
jgi:hypothetical protein